MAYLPSSGAPPGYSRGNPFPPPPVPPPTYEVEIPAAAPPRDDAFNSVALSFTNLVNRTLIAHPCTVLRRQCQIHARARRLHLTPVTLVPVVIKMVGTDGFVTLWKGSLGCTVLYGVTYVTEVVLSDVFGLPRSIVYNGSSEKYWKHVLLKAVNCVAMTPFIVSSFVETVRSGSGLGLAENNVMDVLFRGMNRLSYDFFGAKDAGRRFPIVYLAFPTTAYYVGHFLVSRWAYNAIYGMARSYVLRKAPQERTRFHSVLPDLFAAMTSSLTADLIFYPVETVLHRLYIQGTRTLIDNLDTGVGAISLNAKYSGFFDCFSSIVKHEGVWALYSGVGAIALQYCLQFCVFRTVRNIYDYTTSPAPQQPTVNVNNHVRSAGPSSQVAAPSAQFAAVETPSTPKKSPFPTFAQTSASMEGPQLGQIYSNFNETNNIFGGSTSPPVYHNSPVRAGSDLLMMHDGKSDYPAEGSYDVA
uniref:Solute carrier family 25 member 46 n=1 Tax=Panagrellus redivivus TaxID=6233 RepID=A0A7E4UYY4_PANRE